ncbi:MAG TPA: cytochrome c oxidase subunit II [Steroidobacteraceae bacterium]|nr:cytochrome c oxidase subunit II [Steroidobacteraceae bacterium]
MAQWVPFWPQSAAQSAGVVDRIVIAELALIGLVMFLVLFMMLRYCIRYRQGSTRERKAVGSGSWHVEIGWTAATLVGFFVLFGFGANAYLFLYKTPARADLEIFVVGKQWMWKVQHPGGQREIDAMHLPVDRTVRVILASQDVIHSFFIPAFRLKHDVVPGQFESFWFRPTRIGSFRLECSEFCGTDHAHMTGTVTVMSQSDYARWLNDQGVSGSLAEQGRAVFERFGCSGCHDARSSTHAPLLTGLYGSVVHLADGSAVIADERYIRDCILLPARQRVAGYPPVMPSFAGQLSEEDLVRLLAYLQSLSQGATP